MLIDDGDAVAVSFVSVIPPECFMAKQISISFFGDVVGRPGREAIKPVLAAVQADRPGSIIIVNGENASGGLGIDIACAEEIKSAGAHVLTSGDHCWKFPEFRDFLNRNSGWCIRPANYPAGNPGLGWTVIEIDGARIGVMNLIGRTFMQAVLDCPFRMADQLLADQLGDCDAIFVDFHAEATSEKIAMARHLDGRVSFIVGTHTHVQTADEQILPGGTAFISDAGMCGPFDGVIGMRSDVALTRFTQGTAASYKIAAGRTVVCGVHATIDLTSKKAVAIERIQVRGIQGDS